MAAQTPDISATELLSKLEEEVAAKIQAITGIRAALGLPSWNGSGQVSPAAENTRETSTLGAIRADAFFRMSIPDAIKRYLEIAKQPQSPKAIAEALKAGGVLSSAKKFYANITTALSRMEAQGILTNTPGGWALAEWYAGRAKPSEPVKSKKKVKKRKVGLPKGPASVRNRGPANPVEVATPNPEPAVTWRPFLAKAMKAGKSMAEASAEWKARKGGEPL